MASRTRLEEYGVGVGERPSERGAIGHEASIETIVKRLHLHVIAPNALPRIPVVAGRREKGLQLLGRERRTVVRAGRKPGSELRESANHAVVRVVEDSDYSLLVDRNLWQGSLHSAAHHKNLGPDVDAASAVIRDAPDCETIVAAGVPVSVGVVKVPACGVDRRVQHAAEQRIDGAEFGRRLRAISSRHDNAGGAGVQGPGATLIRGPVEHILDRLWIPCTGGAILEQTVDPAVTRISSEAMTGIRPSSGGPDYWV